MTDMSGYTQREVVATLINESEEVRALGVLADNVHDADAVREPDSMQFPFVVIRWADVIANNGPVHVQALDLWVYDQGSDRTRAEKIVKAAADAVIAGVPVKKLGGYLTQVFDEGQGADMTDDTYDAVVVPRILRAVGSGL
jgi:hypothetical protein